MTSPTLKRIYKASLNFLVPLTPEKTYATIVKEATKLVNAPMGTILLEQNGKLKRVYSSVPLELQIKHRKKGLLYKAFRSAKPTILTIGEIEKAHPEIKELSIASDVVIPLSYRNRTIGILTILSNKEERFSNEEINTLILFGSMASLAIRKAQLYDETRKALEARDFFISTAAHEIKTPVTTIFGYAQLLFDNTKKSKKLKTEWIDSLHAECYRLKFLINDFLEASSINTGRLHYDLKECQLKTITNRVVDNFRFNYPDRKLIFKNNIRAKKNLVIGDFDRLIQALNNLLDNAAKFSASDTIISLTLKSDNSDFIITVKDQGKGIDKKDHTKIFDRYFKSAGNQHEGLGLGLFLVKSIIEYHHGSVSLRSKLNKGTIVEIKLPKIKI